MRCSYTGVLLKALRTLLLCLLPGMATGNDLQPVILQLKWQHQFQFAGYYAAVAKGFYEEAGLDVHIREAQPGDDPIAEVLAGRANYGVGTSELILNRYHGDPVVVLGVIFQHSPLALMTLADSNINHVHKLMGKPVQIEPNSAELFAYLRREGITERGLTLREHTLSLDKLLSGEVLATSVYVTDEPWLLHAAGKNYYLFTPRMSGIDFYGDNVFTTEQEIAAHPKRVAAFREATVRGWKYAMQNKDELINIILTRYSTAHSYEHLLFEAMAMEELMQPHLIEPGYMHPGRWQHIADTYHQLGLLPEDYPVESLLYTPRTPLNLAPYRNEILLLAVSIAGVLALLAFIANLYRRARTNERRLNIMFDNAPMSLIVIDADYRITHWNAQAERTFLWNRQTALGANILDFMVPADARDTVASHLQEVLANQAIVRTRNTNLRQDGERLECEWMNAPFEAGQHNDRRILAMARDITEELRLTRALEHAAHYDALTAIPNRALILELLKQSLAMARRNKTCLGLVFVDLDNFKQINDGYGHQAGDHVLVTTAHRLQSSIREGDYAGRLAGDEFLLILHDIGTRDNALLVTDKVRSNLVKPCLLETDVAHPQASFGISLYPDDSTDLDELVSLADAAMYRDKALTKTHAT